LGIEIRYGASRTDSAELRLVEFMEHRLVREPTSASVQRPAG